MFITEAVTISSIEIPEKYPTVRVLRFKDRLYKVVTASTEEYSVGEVVLYIPDGTILPDYLLKQLGFWDNIHNHGTLKGVTQNIVASHLHAWDPEYLTSGLVLKAKNGYLQGFSGPVSITDPEIVEKLKLTYICKRDMGYFTGDLFMHDVKINKTHVLDIEYTHNTLINEPVEYEELVKGRKFYLSIHRYKSHHHAMGNAQNVYLTTDTLGKYRFLSNTTKNIRGNIFYSAVRALGIHEFLEWELRRNSTWSQFTVGFVLRANAYSGHFPQGNYVRENTVAVDAFIGEVPTGRFLTQEEFHKFCSNYRLNEPEYYGEGIYSLEEVENIKKGIKYGLVVKSDDGKWSGGAYTDAAKLRFIRRETK